MTELITRYGAAHEATGSNAKGQPIWTHKTFCSKCGGAGKIDGYRHIEGGVCFKCGGNGRGPIVSERLYTVEQIAKLNATAAKRAATKLAAAQRKHAKAEAAREALRQERAASLAQDPFFLRLQGYAMQPGRDFLADLFAKLQVYDLSDAQVSAANEAMDRIDARAALAKAANYVGEIGERVEIIGTVDMCRCIHEAEGYWDRSRYLIKIRLDDGNIATWFTGSYYAQGDRLVGKAKVKDHNSYQGIKETLITNPRWKDAA